MGRIKRVRSKWLRRCPSCYIWTFAAIWCCKCTDKYHQTSNNYKEVLGGVEQRNSAIKAEKEKREKEWNDFWNST